MIILDPGGRNIALRNNTFVLFYEQKETKKSRGDLKTLYFFQLHIEFKSSILRQVHFVNIIGIKRSLAGNISSPVGKQIRVIGL